MLEAGTRPSADDDHPSKVINFEPLTCFEANINNTKTGIKAVLQAPLFTKEEMYEA
jgi:hypothetical protein